MIMACIVFPCFEFSLDSCCNDYGMIWSSLCLCCPNFSLIQSTPPPPLSSLINLAHQLKMKRQHFKTDQHHWTPTYMITLWTKKNLRDNILNIKKTYMTTQVDERFFYCFFLCGAQRPTLLQRLCLVVCFPIRLTNFKECC